MTPRRATAGVGRERGHSRPTAGTPAHVAAVAALVRAGARTDRFAAVVGRSAGFDHRLLPKIIPDAYEVSACCRFVVVYEVVVWHALSRTKVERLNAWRRALEASGWSLAVYVVDGLGRGTEIDEDGDVTMDEKRAAMWALERALGRR